MSGSGRPAEAVEGKYRVVSRIGVDGPIERYLAEHVALRRPVELHGLAAGLGAAEPDAASRLLRTARVLGGATHRNLQGVVDTGHDREGRPYVVLELLRGKSLADVIAAHPSGIHLARAGRIVIQIVEAVRALHDSGVVLRALSPHDVMLEALSAGEELVKVRGVAGAALIIEAGAEPLLSESPFVAPELRRGDPGLDPRVDCYSIGMILRVLATGTPEGDISLLADNARRAIVRACAEDPEERFTGCEGLLQAVALIVPNDDRAPRRDGPAPSDPLHADLSYLHSRRTTRQKPKRASRGESRLSLLPVLLTIEAIYRRFGPGVWSELIARVEEADTLLPGAGHTPVHMEKGVPVSLFSDILLAIDDVSGRGDLALIAELGEAVAKRGLRRLFPDLADPLTPDALVSAFPYLWSRVARDGRAKFTRTSERAARLSVERQSTPSLELAGLFAGLLRQALREAGAQSASVVLISCEALGDARDLYGVDWTD